MGLFTKAFWADLAERSLSTAAQAVLAVVGVDVAGDLGAPVNALTLDYELLAGVAAGGALLSVLKAFAKLSGVAVQKVRAERALGREVDDLLKGSGGDIE